MMNKLKYWIEINHVKLFYKILLGKRLYQTSTEMNGSLSFTNNVKGHH